MEGCRDGEQGQGRERVESAKNRGASSERAATSHSGKVAPEADIAVPPGRNQGLESGGGAPAVASEVQQSTPPSARSEEHTSELQSRGHLVCRLLLEKKKEIV